MILYAFDIIANTKKEFNKKKRLFYYYMKRAGISPSFKGIKSLVAIHTVDEGIAFESIMERVGGIKAVKIYATNVEEKMYP